MNTKNRPVVAKSALQTEIKSYDQSLQRFRKLQFLYLFTVTCLYVRLPVFKSVAKAQCVSACSPNNSRVARWIIGVIGPAVKLMTSC